jgi:hypothetical protein
MTRLFLLALSPLAISVAFADSVPQFNIERACQSAEASAVAPGRTSEGCQNDEKTAQNTLQQRWSEFAGPDRDRCIRTAGMGGPSSYVDLLTCLDMAKTARTLPKDELTPMQPASR